MIKHLAIHDRENIDDGHEVAEGHEITNASESSTYSVPDFVPITNHQADIVKSHSAPREIY